MRISDWSSDVCSSDLLEVQPEELVYLKALVDAHNEREPGVYGSHTDIFAHPSHGSNLRTHRERYFEADGFQKFYRDNTPPDIIDNFRRDIHLGVRETLRQPAADQRSEEHTSELQSLMRISYAVRCSK